ncbi:MAG: type II toxin-antitoxin system RelE/ParE family toxin [Deltaproteobacteria bacterium]|nr:type II toxin-antitoxin system RelE/ParE family toxin [Deltaproteobacteria bacterium]
MARRYAIDLAPTAFASLRRLANRKTLRELGEAIDGLAHEPDLQGKPLAAPLEGIWSIRAARDHYRVLYEIDETQRRVTVLVVGERRPGEQSDVYRLAARLLRDLTT